MFGTLHWNFNTKEADFVERPHGASDPEKNSACDRCRAKKVKCNTNYDGCSRCKRLGKTCTFSSIKQRGDQRVRKTVINSAQQKRSVDLLIQSSAFSSSKDTGHEDEVCSAKRPLASLPPASHNIHGGESGQQLLVEPLIDRFVDAPPNFDLSLLTEFGQQTSDQYGDDFFDLSISPLPFSPTILPNTDPEPIPPAAVKTSENPLSPPLSSEDEIPHYLPPTGQSQDSSPFEVNSNATPTSLLASTFLSTALSSQNPSGQPCQCLAAVIFAVEEFEASCNSGNRADLDSIVAHQKEAINRCRSMLNCGTCMARRENLVLLVFMTERIVAACARIVVLYRTKDSDNINNTNTTSTGAVGSFVPPSLSGCLPTSRIPHRAINLQDRDLARSSSPSSSPPSNKPKNTPPSSFSFNPSPSPSSSWQALLLGDYEISSPLEWEHLIRVLIFLQLRAVMELLVDMRTVGGEVLGEMQREGLVRAGVRVGELEREVCCVV